MNREQIFAKVSGISAQFPTAYRMPREQLDATQLDLLKASFEYHVGNNVFYRSICEEANFLPKDVKGVEDLLKIPLVPVRLFKQAEAARLMSVSLRDVEMEIRSTGTGGVPSVARRDAYTMHLVMLTFNAMYREFMRFSRGAGVFMCPSCEEMPEMGMVKAFHIMSGLIDSTHYLVRENRFNPDEATELLERFKGKHTRHIVGPPFIIYTYLQHLERKGMVVPLDASSRMVMLGGWKRFTGQQIPRAKFNQMCAERLRLEPHQIRDMYGMIETNMLAMECEHNNMHTPPWARLTCRDIRDPQKEVPMGKNGIIGIMDPASIGYPGFILTEDVGVLKPGEECACGRTTPILQFSRRLEGAELGCCAVSLDRFMCMAQQLGAPEDEGTGA
jgi:long-chain-fatty-acid---luciferin-component ligase